MYNFCNHCMAQSETEITQCPVCGKSNTCKIPAHHLLPGTVLNARFYVGMAIGEGGFGITYIGYDMKLNMKVAIKEFYPNGFVNRSNTTSPMVNDSVTEGSKDFFEKGRERFLSEARTLAMFSGEPGIVDVRDFFEENNTAYIVMEYLDGIDLKTFLRENGTMAPESLLQLLMPVMNSLKKVHAQGLIHRDISPDNIMIVGNNVKLLDFGAARSVSLATNKSLSVMIKPGFAPEEQYRSKGEQGPWTDVYALCATMYKCITGITPDDATQRVYNDEVKAPSALNVAIRPEFERAIMKGMSVRQSDRYQNIDELIMALQGMDTGVYGYNNTAVPPSNNVVNNFNNAAPNNYNAAPNNYNTAPNNYNTAPNNYIPNNGMPAYTPNNAPVNPNAQKGKSKTGLIVIAAIAVVIVGIIIAVMAMSGGGDTDTTVNADVSSTSQAQDEATSIEDASEDTDKQETEKEDASDENAEIVMSDELYDFTFKLEGVVYKLPCDYSDFTKNGWTISSSGISSESKIAGDSYDSFTMSNDGSEVMVSAYNMSGNAKSIKDCKIGAIDVSTYDKVDFSIAKGITVNSTLEDIKSAFGTPGYSNSGSEYESVTYYAKKDSTYNSVKFYCSTDGSYNTIELKNFIETEDDTTTTSSERPAYLDEYVAPTSMGSNLKSAVAKIEGDLYQLPAPVSEFINNGWKIIETSGDVVAGGTDYIRMEKNSKKLTLYIINYAEYQTTVENCAVYKVSADEYNEASLIIGSKDNPVSIGMTKADFEQLVTDEFDYYEGTYSDSYYYSEYSERDFGVDIDIDKETGKISSLDLSCKTWDY